MKRSRRVVFLITVIMATTIIGVAVARAQAVHTVNQVAEDDSDKARGMFIW
ncbi:MAG: hypothetical protein JWN15_1402 [Firmicutes bacterium]|nr:hypothetical protein [Bacillota bacterium]